MEAKAKIGWIVIDKEFPNVPSMDFYREEPDDYIMQNEYQYHVKKIVYFEVE